MSGVNRKQKDAEMKYIIEVSDLHKGLNENGYICNVEFASKVASAVNAKPVGGAFLYGVAGTGKSYLPQVLAGMLKRELYFHQCSPGTREDDILMRIMPDENTKSGVKEIHGKVLRAAEASVDSKVLLVLDEWDKTRPSADGFLLDFLQYGRLTLKGEDVIANLDNMLIFFTANDERDFQEALLRRFPKIDIEPLMPEIVQTALAMTHANHEHLPNCITLYVKCLMAGIAKPATIQELRQLMDAIKFLGGGADWDSLVYQYVTKTRESHEMLASIESQDIDGYVDKMGSNYTELDSKYYGSFEVAIGVNESVKSKLPKLSEIREYKTEVSPMEIELDNANVYGIFERNEKSYSTMVHMAKEVPDEPNDFGWAQVIKNKIIISKPMEFTDIPLIAEMINHKDRKDNGEILFRSKYASLNEVHRMIKHCNRTFVKVFSKSEIIGRTSYGIDFRWTPESGLEIIVDIKENKHGDSFLDKITMLLNFGSRPLFCNAGYYNGRANERGASVENYFDCRNDKNLNHVVKDFGTLTLKSLSEHGVIIKSLYSGSDAMNRVVSSKIDMIANSINIDDNNATIYSCGGVDVKLTKDTMLLNVHGKFGAPGLRLIEAFVTHISGSLVITSVFKADKKKMLKYMRTNNWRISGTYAAFRGNQCMFIDDYVVMSCKFVNAVTGIRPAIARMKRMRSNYASD